MLVGLTGLHGSGKSYFANNIPSKFGFKVYSKKDLIPYICNEITGRLDWKQWYKEEFNKDAYNITTKILSYMNLKENVILDSVHSSLEWNIISSIYSDSELIGVIAPEFVRQQRRKADDKEKDNKRIEYWHTKINGVEECLLSNLDWTFNGAASLEINEKLFEEFLQYIHKKELSINMENINFSDNKKEKLELLMEENRKLKEKLNVAEQLLQEYIKFENLEGKEEKIGREK